MGEVDRFEFDEREKCGGIYDFDRIEVNRDCAKVPHRVERPAMQGAEVV